GQGVALVHDPLVFALALTLPDSGEIAHRPVRTLPGALSHRQRAVAAPPDLVLLPAPCFGQSGLTTQPFLAVDQLQLEHVRADGRGLEEGGPLAFLLRQPGEGELGGDDRARVGPAESIAIAIARAAEVKAMAGSPRSAGSAPGKQRGGKHAQQERTRRADHTRLARARLPRMMLTMLSSTMSTSGEKSMAPVSGMTRRIGRRIGSSSALTER